MSDPARFDYDLLCMGRSSIDLYAHEVGVPITAVKSFDAYVGGCPTNVSVGTRRLGLRTALLTAVGEDQVGDFVLHFLETEGVETRFIPRKAGRRTSAVVLTIQPPDRFPLTFYRDNCADIALTAADVEAAPIASSRFVFLSGTGLSLEPSRGATFHAAARAKAAGARLVVDLDYRADQWPSVQEYARHVQRLLGGAAVAVGTEEEAIAAAGGAPLDAAIEAVMKTGVPAFVLKRGARGSTIIREDGSRSDVPPFRVEVLNVLGAGDAFASGLIYGLREGWPLEEAARFGNAVGAIVVTRHGCANFMPTLAEVREFIARSEAGA